MCENGNNNKPIQLRFKNPAAKRWCYLRCEDVLLKYSSEYSPMAYLIVRGFHNSGFLNRLNKTSALWRGTHYHTRGLGKLRQISKKAAISVDIRTRDLSNGVVTYYR
jgi:hypothetical protein